MAFRSRYGRFSRRRTGRFSRRRGRGSYPRRWGRSARRSYRGRRPRMTPRRVRNIAARKKNDTIFGATQNDVQSEGTVTLVAGTNYYMWCPTWRQRRPGAKSINGSEDAISLLVTVFIRKGAA